MLVQTEANSSGQFGVELTYYGDEVLVVSLRGELDLAVIEAAHRALTPAIAVPGSLIVIDLTELEFLGTSGVALFYALARAREGADSLRLIPSRHGGVNRVLELTEIGSTIPIVAG